MFGGSDSGKTFGGGVPTGGPTGGGASKDTPGGMVVPSFGNGMGQGALGQYFAALFAQQQAQSQLAPQTIPAITPASNGGKPGLISQQSNPINLFGRVPIILGTMVITNYLSAMLWMSFREGDNNNDVYVGYMIAYGPVGVTSADIKVGDALIDDLSESNTPGRPGIAYQLQLSEDDDPLDLVLYDTHTTIVDKELRKNEKVVRLCPQDADLILIAFLFPNGLQQTTTTYTTVITPADPEDPESEPSSSTSSNTVTSSASVSFQILYRLVGAMIWEEAENVWTVTKESTDPIFVAFEFEPPTIDQYEFQVKRLTDNSSSSDLVNASRWFSISGVLHDNPPYGSAPPKAADGSDAFFAKMEMQGRATGQVQNSIDLVTMLVSSLVPVFNNNLGLDQAFYHVDDRPPADDNVIDDTSGNDFDATITILDYDFPLPEWTEAEPRRLNFNGNAKIEPGHVLSPAGISTARIVTTILPSLPTGSHAGDENNPVFRAELSGSGRIDLSQNVTTGDVTCQIVYGGSDTLTVPVSAPIGVERKLELVFAASGDAITDVTLNVYDSDDDLIGTDTISGLAIDQDMNFIIGQQDSGETFFGQIYDAEFYTDEVLLMQYPINDFVLPDLPGDVINNIADSFGLEEGDYDGTLSTTGDGPFWTEEFPSRLIFSEANQAHFTSPISFDTDFTTGISISASFIGSGAAAVNPIFSCNKMTVYQEPATGDLVFLYTGGAEPYELRLTDAAPVDEERRVILDINPNEIHSGSEGSNIHINLRTVDEDNETIATIGGDIDTGPTGDAAIVSNLVDIGTNGEAVALVDTVYFTGRIWDVAIFAQQPMFNKVRFASNNPALECLYLMREKSFNPNPIPDELIDFPAFYEWSKHCAQLGYECFAYLDQPEELWAVLDRVAECGRGKVVRRNGLYAPAMDLSRLRTNVLPTQHFTRFNSSGFKLQSTGGPKYHAVPVNYLNPDTRPYEQAQVIVYAPGYDASNASSFAQALNFWGCKSKADAQRKGRRWLADYELRSNRYELTTDWCGLVCAMGDHVYVSHDAALIGTAAGTITSKNIEAGLVASVTIDQGCTFETGKTYAVRICDSRLGSILADVVNPGDGIFYELEFASPIPEEDFEFVIEGDVFQFGEQNIESMLMIVDQIDRLPDHASRFILKEYQEGVYEFEHNAGAGIPEYVSTARIAPQYRFVPPVPEVSSITPDALAFTVVVDTVSVDDVKYLQVNYRIEGSDSAWTKVHVAPAEAAPTSIEIFEGLIAATDYEVRVRSISFASVASDWTELETVSIT